MVRWPNEKKNGPGAAIRGGVGASTTLPSIAALGVPQWNEASLSLVPHWHGCFEIVQRAAPDSRHPWRVLGPHVREISKRTKPMVRGGPRRGANPWSTTKMISLSSTERLTNFVVPRQSVAASNRVRKRTVDYSSTVLGASDSECEFECRYRSSERAMVSLPPEVNFPVGENKDAVGLAVRQE